MRQAFSIDIHTMPALPNLCNLCSAAVPEHSGCPASGAGRRRKLRGEAEAETVHDAEPHPRSPGLAQEADSAETACRGVTRGQDFSALRSLLKGVYILKHMS